MSVTRLADIVEPQHFTDYIVANTMQKNALVQAGVAVRNDVITSHLEKGSHSFTVPNWFDLGDQEANIANDDPDDHSTPYKIASGKQLVRKAFLHNSWSAMNLASEIAGSDAIARIKDRVAAYWSHQLQRRLIASLQGIVADNIANNDGDLVHDISSGTGDAGQFSAAAVIDAVATLGDNLEAVSAIAMHSDVYRSAMKRDLIATVMDSAGRPFQTFRGLAVVIDDGLPNIDDAYTSVMFGAGAIGYGITEPSVADGTEVESLPSAGNGGGQQVLHSRVNVGVHPAGFTWTESEVTGESPTLAELRNGGNWRRVFERKAIPLAFLVSKA
ncbi:major capsid protein [Luteimonas sp. e5]